MKALVTGGGGFLGGAVVAMLRARGDSVRSFSRGRYPRLETLGVASVQGDLMLHDGKLYLAGGNRVALASYDLADGAFQPARATKSFADRRGPRGDDLFLRADVTGTENVIEACRRQGVGRLVHTSSPSVVFDGRDEEGIDEAAPYAARFLAAYPRTKALAEQRVLAANGPDLATVALRPHLIWGPGDPHLAPRILARARAGRLRLVGRRANRVDSTYIDNAAHAHLLAADRLRPGARCAGRVYFVSNGEPVPMAELVNRILACADLEPVARSVPPGLAYGLGATLEWLHRRLGIRSEPLMTRFVARQLATAHWFDLGAAERDLDYRPLIDMDEGMRRLRTSLADR